MTRNLVPLTCLQTTGRDRQRHDDAGPAIFAEIAGFCHSLDPSTSVATTPAFGTDAAVATVILQTETTSPPSGLAMPAASVQIHSLARFHSDPHRLARTRARRPLELLSRQPRSQRARFVKPPRRPTARAGRGLPVVAASGQRHSAEQTATCWSVRSFPETDSHRRLVKLLFVQDSPCRISMSSCISASLPL